MFYFGCYGLGTEQSELAFPISSEIVLLGDRRSRQVNPPAYLNLPQSTVKEVNRRVASEATRFVFYKEQQEWIPVITKKKDPYLSRIMWRDG